MSKLKKPISFTTAFQTFIATEILGEGGAGRVYAATDESNNPVAVKLLDPEKAGGEKLKRFKNEYAFCSSTLHPNILRVSEYGRTVSDKPAPFFVMPRYEGSLRLLMQSSLSAMKRLQIFSKILDGIEAAHLLGVTHRDIKPENVLVRANGDEVVIADFGIARFTANDLITAVETKSSTRLANFMYAAPEQRDVGKEVDARADIYALGLILNEMFTGSVPHGTGYRRIEGFDQSLAYLDGIVEQMIQQSRSKRIQTVSEVKSILIGHRNEFVARQELDAAKRQVVPSASAFGELYDNPPSIIGADWDGATLMIQLSRDIPREWILALQNMGSYSSVMGKDPAAFRFIKDKAYISARESEVQMIIDHFKGWIPSAQAQYRYSLERDRQRAEEAERKRLRDEVEAAERRARVLGNIRI